MHKLWISVLAVALVTSTSALAQDKANKTNKGDKSHSAAEVQKDVLNHRAMADAHSTAARCLESGKGAKECHAQLAKECKGLGIGTLCGMQHKH